MELPPGLGNAGTSEFSSCTHLPTCVAVDEQRRQQERSLGHGHASMVQSLAQSCSSPVLGQRGWRQTILSALP